MDRRQFVAAAALPFVAGRLYALPAGSAPRLLVVFLRGAYDAANIVIPADSAFYYAARPTIAIPRTASLPLVGGWALHPALSAALMPMWQAHEIAFVPFAGTDDLSRSHFETQDTIELGQPINASRDYRSGFLGRLTTVLAGRQAIAFTAQLPLAFRGNTSVPNIALNHTGKPALAGHTADLVQAMYQGERLAPAVSQGFQVQQDTYQALAAEMATASRGAVSTKGFEASAQRIGILMRERFNLGFVDVGGWDTHVNQGGADGYLANRIGELGRGLAVLKTALGPAWSETIVIVVSEFGRTFRENGNRGTDHGHGSVYWVAGGAVRGGQIAGNQVAVIPANLFQNRDWPVLNDYRALIGGIVQRAYGLDATRLTSVFPQVAPADLALL
jgi:uncharacterized protein (DUF1501 family)